jgi:manganese-dependent inorganic pyrophosphatase
MSMDKTVFVIGHKNPDTDSIVSAIAYAELKRATGMPEARAARAGAVNPQTEYVLDRFGVEAPEFLPDLVPKVEYYVSGPARTVSADAPLWEALAMLREGEGTALPIVDAEGRYKALLHYSSFAENILARVNPRKKSIVSTSVGHIARTIKAQVLVPGDERKMFKASIVVAANDAASVRSALTSERADDKIFLVGDRTDAQRIAVEAGVRVLVITNGMVPDKETRELAAERGVPLLVSPYDTTSTALLVIYSTPAIAMSDLATKPVFRGDRLKDAAKAIAASPSRSAAVVDEEGRVLGLLDEGDLLAEPKVEVIMVDHNEHSQAVEGIDNYRVLEVIDHHRIGSFSSRYPITFINRVVGSTSTLVAGMYRDERVPIPRAIASILLCGILSDTICLRSATTTEADLDAAEYLSNLADLELAEIGSAIMAAAASAAGRPADEMVKLDFKEYEAQGAKLSVSQIEVSDTSLVMERREEILEALRAVRREKGLYFSALLVTDITELDSLLFVAADKDFESLLAYPTEGGEVYRLKGVLSRKKQLMPALFEVVEKALG